MANLRVPKSNKNARGTVACDNTTMHLLQANDFVADAIRKNIADRNILMVNVVSSAGSGKTSLMQETVKRLGDQIKILVVDGNIEQRTLDYILVDK